MAKTQKTSAIKTTFEQLYGRALTEQEMFTIKHSLAGFFSVLIKIDQHQRKNNEQSK